MIQTSTLKIDKELFLILDSLNNASNKTSETALVDNLTNMFSVAKKFGLVNSVFDYYNISMLESESDFKLYNEVANKCLVLLNKVCFEVISVFNNVGLNPLTFKGFHFLNTIYKYKSKYIVNDIDILIKKSQILIAKDVMNSIGYSQNILNTSNSVITLIKDEIIEEFEGRHYELFPFTKIIEVPEFKSDITFIQKHLEGHPFIIEDDKIYFAIEIDIHHNLSIGFDEIDIWQEQNKFKVDNYEYSTLGNNILAWFLPARFYNEIMVFNKIKLKLLSDIAHIVNNESLNYDTILLAADKYHLHPSLFYVYSYLKNILNMPIPGDFLNKLNISSNINSSYRDWGDFVPKIVNTRIVTTSFNAV